MQPRKQLRKAGNSCLIPSSKSATKPTRASSSRLAICLPIFLLWRERKEGICDECHAFSQRLFARDASALGSRSVLFTTGREEYVAEPVLVQTAGRGDD